MDMLQKKAWNFNSARTYDVVQAAAVCGESDFNLYLTPQSPIACNLDASVVNSITWFKEA